MKVLVVGRISLYEAGGSYQIYVEHMEPDGIGALYQELEERKEKLMKEGLFKGLKNAATFPKANRGPYQSKRSGYPRYHHDGEKKISNCPIGFVPNSCTRKPSSGQCCQEYPESRRDGQFRYNDHRSWGGSIEDLWPFNEERVARAIYQANTPVISSVGHETDTTIADLVADVRAATPTAAAELAVPVLSEELMRIQERQARLQQAFVRQIQRKQERFERARRSYVFRQPERLYEGQTIKLDQLKQRLYQATQQIYHAKEKQTIALSHQLEQVAPLYRVKAARQETAYLEKRLEEKIQQYMKQQQQRFAQAVQSLDLLSPLKIMGRGYSYTTLNDQVVKVSPRFIKDLLTIHYQDGIVKGQVQEIDKGE